MLFQTCMAPNFAEHKERHFEDFCPYNESQWVKKTTLDLIDFLCLGKNNNMFIQVLDDIKVRKLW